MKSLAVILLVCLFVPDLLADEHHHHHHRDDKHHHHDKHFSGAHQRHAVNHHQNRFRNRDLNNTSGSSTPNPSVSNSTQTIPVENSTNSQSNNQTSSGNQVSFWYNANVTLIAFYNSSAQIAAVFNYSGREVLIVSSRGGVLLESSTQRLSDVNLTLSQDFQSFFANLANLEGLAQNAPSGSLTPPPPSENTSTPSPQSPGSSQSQQELLAQAAVQLGFNSSNHIETLVALSKVFLQDHTRGLRGILVGSAHFNLARGGVERFATVSQGVQTIFNYVPGGVQALYRAGGRLDFEGVLNAPNGVQALVRILLSIKGSRLDLGKIVQGSGLNELEVLLKIVILLGGNDNGSGVDRVIKLAYTILDVIKHQGNYNALFRILVEFANSGVELNGADVKAALNELANLARTQAPGFLAPLIKLLQNLNDNNLILEGAINLTKVIALLRTGNVKGAFEVVLTVLVHFSGSINPAHSIPRFFGFVLGIINSRNSSLNISGLLPPGVDPQQLQQILQSGNLSQILQSGNLNRIPVIGTIVARFTLTLQRISNGSLNFQQILQGQGSINAVISAFTNSTQGFSFINDIIKNPFGSWPWGIIGIPPIWGPGPVINPGGIIIPWLGGNNNGTTSSGGSTPLAHPQGSSPRPEASTSEAEGNRSKSKNKGKHHKDVKHLHEHAKHFDHNVKHHEKYHHGNTY